MPFTVNRPPTSDEELYWYIRLRFGVIVPRTPVCPDHIPPFRAFADAYFGRNSLNPQAKIQSLALWHGSRGLSGKSFMLSLLAIVNAELHGVDVNLLGGSLSQSLNIHEHVGMMLDYVHAPDYMIVERTNTKITYTNKARIRPLTASQKTVRGPHPPRLLLDEIDEMELAVLDAALGQPMRQRNYLRKIIAPYTVMCSTWQNPQGTFTEVRRRAEEQGIPVYQWCFLESANPKDGWLTQEAIEEKRATIPKQMWETEYELNEPSIGNRAFDTPSVDRAFSLSHLPEHLDPDDPETPLVGGYLRGKEARDFEEFTYENPLRGGEYVVAADWAKERDYTVIGVGRIDVWPFRLVYYMKVNRRPYPQMVGFFNKVINRYHAAAIHDSTGVGVAVDDYVDESAVGFTMTGEKRSGMLTEYVSAIEHDEWVFPRIPSIYIAHKYAQVGDLYSQRTKEFHLPDEVAMMGLMHHMARNRVPLVGPPDLVRPAEAQTKHERQVDPPRRKGNMLAAPSDEPRRVGDVVKVGESAGAYSLGG